MRPTAVKELRRACAAIVAVDSWPDVFRRLGLPCPARSQVEHRLLTAVENSALKGDHSGGHRRSAEGFAQFRLSQALPSCSGL